MPRKARLFVPGCLHHVMSRGLDGIALFRDDEDRWKFLELFQAYYRKAGVRCYAWVLMSNHYHFVLRTSDIPLGKLFRPLHTRYAGYFNKKYKRRGYLFQDRFKSIATQEQLYLENLVRYVHLNPIRAGILKDIKSLDNYPWSGHCALIGKKECAFQDCDTVLRRFGGKKGDARAAYRRFLSEGFGLDENASYELFRTGTQGGPNRGDPHRWVIGDPVFVRNALANDNKRRIRIAQYSARGLTIDDICKKVAVHFRITPQVLKNRCSRGIIAEARKALAFLCHKRLEIPVVEIARFLNVNGSAVSMMFPEGEELVRRQGCSKLID
jgi:putative transposase